MLALCAGLGNALRFAGLDDLLIQIDACDPDIVDLRKLGRMGDRIKPMLESRFPGREVIALSDDPNPRANPAGWRTYDPLALVSIVLPVYNGTKYLAQSLESCLNQTHQNVEIIIVDDGSVDDTSDIINKYSHADNRIRTIANPRNRGLPESLNIGFATSKGSFLTWTSHDNIYAPTAIQYMVQQLCTYTQIGIVYCSTHHIGETDNGIDNTCVHRQYEPSLPPIGIHVKSVFNACFLYRREVMEEVGPYRSEFRYCEDWDFFMRAFKRFPAKAYVEPCYFYRLHSGSLTTQYSDAGRNWKVWRERLQSEHFQAGRNLVTMPTPAQLMPVGVPHREGR